MKENVSIKEKFAQMILLGLDVPSIDTNIINLIQSHKIGGVVLYKKNYKTYEEMLNFINKLKEINRNNTPLFIGIDQENGRVNRLPVDILAMPSAKRQTKDYEVLCECNEITAKLLSNVGVNMNFAPVLDIDHENNNLIGNRSYGVTKEEVINYAIPLINDLNKEGIISVPKHFPGHGLPKGDSHIILPIIKDIKTLEEVDLYPFNELIKMNTDAIMVSHLRIKGFGLKPATMNKKIINKYLSNYNGLLVTDDIKMNIMKYLFGIPKIIKNSIEANHNLIMIKYQKEDMNLYNQLFSALETDYFDKEKINISYNKILKLKEKYHLNNDILTNKINIEEINNKISSLNKSLEQYEKK